MCRPKAGASMDSFPVGAVVPVNGPKVQDSRSPLRSRLRSSQRASHPARDRRAGGHEATVPAWVNCNGRRRNWQAWQEAVYVVRTVDAQRRHGVSLL